MFREGTTHLVRAKKLRLTKSRAERATNRSDFETSATSISLQAGAMQSYMLEGVMDVTYASAERATLGGLI